MLHAAVGPCFPDFFLTADVPLDAFLVAFHILCQIQGQLGFGFPNSITARSDSLYSSQVTWPYFHLLYTSFICLSLVRNSLFIHVGLLPPWLDFLLSEMDFSWDGRRWSLNTIQPLGPCSPHGCIPQDSSKEITKETKVFSPEVQGCDPGFSPALSSQDPELH